MEMGLDGAMVQMLSHGLVSGAMFLCVGVMYDRVHSREISAYGGVVNTMPQFAAFMVLFAMANAGLPGTSGFVGEFLVILASFKANVWYAFLAATTLVLGAGLHAVAGEAGDLRRQSPTIKVAALKDLNGREFLVLGVLAVAVLRCRLLAGAAARRDARHDAASGRIRPGLEDRSLGLGSKEAPMTPFNVADFNAGLDYAGPEIFLGLAACAILLSI